MDAEVFDSRICELGEGPLWHPGRGQAFWFDILGKRMLSRDGDQPLDWGFDGHVSAAGWVDKDTLLIASETALSLFDIASGKVSEVVPLEADNPATRSNDGRADRQGGFWIGTMGKKAETGAGAIYRYHSGKMERLMTGITIPNAICFAPDGRLAYYADTPAQVVMAQPLDAEGWPTGAPRVFLDLAAQDLSPDGAVVDAEGCVWLALWGAGRVSRYGPDGGLLDSIAIPAAQSTCPCFIGAALDTLMVTTGRERLVSPHDGEGATYFAKVPVRGLPEPKVRISREASGH
ncbi:SMP-30/gluconolactonase/LRE family protein [Anianabacter salinae]|uniref:SMP-30/gluconolactonase/LRE family protein n=1 Tax=Anianabacter salinae TaxID=2851023 RepID=UPI00225E4EDC|nr:SMP-30/gluconolactonase/LRE family protein [Anianabacter salinae]MBV0912784.1 SMP-30/gluconolactonase/LRE family protein [Anianabacter salinae]